MILGDAITLVEHPFIPGHLTIRGHRQTLKRCGRPEEVANMVLFPASDKASYCTAAYYLVDGGQLASY